MRQHVLLSEAVNEIAEAFQWYEFRSAGLGRRFVDAVTSVVEIACETPAILNAAGGGDYRALINEALRAFVTASASPDSDAKWAAEVTRRIEL